jgi:serine/threonine protein phosphatase PrpC
MDAMRTQPGERAVSILEWGVSSRVMPGEHESGDVHLVAALPGGALAAVVDGLGHGPEAAKAAALAVDVMRRLAQEPVAEIIQRCHEELRKTRGAVISLASFHSDMNTMTWLGIGNVEGLLFRAKQNKFAARESLLLRGGVVGYQLPPLRPVTLPVFVGDTVVLATDGISGRFGDRWVVERVPQDVADEILREDAKGTDDALVLVARYLGGQS